MLQFNLMVLLFAIVTLVKLRQSVESVMLDVLLPVLLLMPAYSLCIPSVPRLTCYDVVLFPLGVSALVLHFDNWHFRRTDIWVVAFALAAFYTDYINLDLKNALMNFPDPGLLGGVFAYFIGRLMIEQTDNREQVAKRVVVLLAAVGLISVGEFVGKKDLFIVSTRRFFGHIDYWGDQYRSGFLRVKGPFAGAENAGIVFLLGFFLSLWLWYLYRHRTNVSEPKYLRLRRSALWVGAILLGLSMTLSRGPVLGAAVGYLIAVVGLAKRKRLAMIVSLLLLAVGGVIAHRKAVEYSRLPSDEDAPGKTATTEADSSATYRTRLYRVYKQVAEDGGLFGWSGSLYREAASKYPDASSFNSIDNEYLLIWVAQGKVGLSLFILILAEGAIGLILAIVHSRHVIDTCFYFCLGGMLVGLVVVISTVFLAGQGFILFFLLIGWIQSLPGPDNAWWAPSGPRFVFRRVLT